MGLAALMLSVGILLSRVLGYLRDAVIAYQQGAGAETDAYNAAFMLPDLMNYFLAGGTLSITFIPLFNHYLAKDDEAGGWRLFSVIATVMGLVLVVGIVAAELFTETLVDWLFPGFAGETRRLTVEMTRIVLPCQLFHYLGGLILATLMAHGRFAAATLAPLVYNGAIVVCGLILGPSMGMHGFAVGALVGAVLGPFGLSLWLARRMVRYRPTLAVRSEGFRRYILLSVPLMLGVSLLTVDEWLGRILGSDMEEGTISWLNYARRLMLVPIAVIGQAASQAALPFLSRLAAEGRREELAEILMGSLHYVLLLAMLSAGLLVALAEPTIATIYEHGAFSPGDTARTARVLELFAIGIGAWGVQLVASRAFYAEQNTWTPMVVSTAVTLVAVPVYWLLGRALQAEGLALASTVGMTMQAVATLWVYRQRNRSVALGRLGESLARGAVLGVSAAVVAWGVARLLEGRLGERSLEGLVQLVAGGGLGLVSAAVVARFVVPRELEALRGRLARLGARVLRRKR